MTGLAVAIVAAAIIGFAAGRWRRTTTIEAAATRSLAILRTRQTDDDRATIRALPPMVTVADVLDHASRLGIGVTEAADSLYRLRVRALLDGKIRTDR